MSARGWRVGVDIGGTFTDIVASDGAEVRIAKTPTRPDAHAAALAEALVAVDLDWPEVVDMVHGTTLVTNALVERRLARTALVATAGFADTIEIGRASRAHLYHLDRLPKLPPLVPRELRFEVAERLDAHGAVLEPLYDDALDRLLAALAAADVEAVAVCLLHAYANPVHERRLGEALAGRYGAIALSHRIAPEAREFERMTTTVLSAAVMPRVRRFVAGLTAAPADGARHHFVHSANGMAAADIVRDQPLLLAMSGPAAGVAAATAVVRQLGRDDALTFDMGGTTTDVCLVRGGRAEVVADRRLAGHRLRLPMVAVDSIGAGGGSIARLVDGALQVGPESAGAEPGPACYGRGGAAPTITDANLVLGRLGTERPLGGTVRLDPDLARVALAPLAAAMGLSLERCALGILEVAQTQMARALRRVTVERGIDARGLALVAYGGAGPMHAAELARHAGLGEVLVPRLSSGLSAWGCVTAVRRLTRQRTLHAAGVAFEDADLERLRAVMQGELEAELGAAAGTATLATTALVRYRGQSFEIAIDEPELASAAALSRQFRDAHETLYGFASDEPIRIVALRVELELPTEPTATAPSDAGQAVGGARRAWFERDGPVDLPVCGRDDAALHSGVAGPLAIEDTWTTVVVPPSSRVRADVDGHLRIILDER